jgi:hypothetical protein
MTMVGDALPSVDVHPAPERELGPIGIPMVDERLRDRLRDVHFGPWYSLVDAFELVPDVPGVVQLRAPSILRYPKGQSAMIHYACSPDHEPLSRFMSRQGRDILAHAARHGATLVRYGESEQPARDLARLLGNFTTRFGSPPLGNAVPHSATLP